MNTIGRQTTVPSRDLARYVPYAVGKSSEGLGWRGVRAEIVRGHEPGEIRLPALDHALLNLIVRGPTLHDHRWDGRAVEQIGREGAASLVAAGCESYWRWSYLTRETACDFHLHLKPSFVRRIAREDAHSGGESPELRGELCFYDATVRQIGTALLEEVDSGGANGALYAESLTTALVLVLLRLQSRSPGAVQRETWALSPVDIRRVCDYIEAHLGTELHLEDLAALVGLGPGSFARAFRSASGSTPHQYVMTRRTLRAEEMLISTRLPLTEIALRLGFAHHAHFASTFRRRTGVTPSRYRLLATR